MEIAAKKRIEWIDILRGVAIIFVIIGHLTYFPGNNALKEAIYSFHMALFFVLAGCTTNLSYKNASLWQFVKKKSVALLLPYTVWNFLPLPYPGLDVLSNYNFVERFEIFVSGRCNNGGAFWFLLTLFALQCIFALYVGVIEKRVRIIWLRILILLLMYVPVVALHVIFGGKGSAWGLATQVYFFYVPFMVGVCMMRYQEVWKFLFNKWMLFLFVILALYVPSIYGYVSNMGHLSRLSGIGITCILICIINKGQFLSPEINRKLATIGKFSLGIYVFHYTFTLSLASCMNWMEGFNSLVTFCLYLPLSLVISFLCIAIVRIIEVVPMAALFMLGQSRK